MYALTCLFDDVRSTGTVDRLRLIDHIQLIVSLNPWNDLVAPVWCLRMRDVVAKIAWYTLS